MVSIVRFYQVNDCLNTEIYLGGYNVGVPPLPIPNREVKPNRADGTAFCGRVGSRHFKRVGVITQVITPTSFLCRVVYDVVSLLLATIPLIPISLAMPQQGAMQRAMR